MVAYAFYAKSCSPDGATDMVTSLIIPSFPGFLCRELCLSQVTIGKTTYVCVTLGPLNWFGNGTSLRVSSTPTADEISSVNIRNGKHYVNNWKSMNTSLCLFLSPAAPRLTAWSDDNYAHDIALSKLQIPFMGGAGMGVTVSSMGKLSYQVVF